jgi:hypothetical protein
MELKNRMVVWNWGQRYYRYYLPSIFTKVAFVFRTNVMKFLIKKEEAF